jgi:hypothetical protein
MLAGEEYRAKNREYQRRYRNKTTQKREVVRTISHGPAPENPNVTCVEEELKQEDQYSLASMYLGK